MKLLTTILIYLLLRLNGWKACKLHDGGAGWKKIKVAGPHPSFARSGEITTIELIGDWRYALQHL